VLVDTSAWIAYFRREEPCFGLVLELLDDDRICCVGLILAELLQGVRSENEAAHLLGFPHLFDFLPESMENWVSAGSFANRLRKKGRTVGLADCYIAAVAQANGLSVLTLDNHFTVLRDEGGVNLVQFTSKEKR
jgi:predicted nucleic acid-binding protein